MQSEAGVERLRSDIDSRDRLQPARGFMLCDKQRVDRGSLTSTAGAAQGLFPPASRGFVSASMPWLDKPHASATK